MFLEGQQTGSRQPQGASSVTGAQEGRAQLDVTAPSCSASTFSVACLKQEETRKRFDYFQPPQTFLNMKQRLE